MAEEATGKTIKQLKQERTSAKSAFTKLANYLNRAVGHLTKSELQKEFRAVTSLARDVNNTNDSYELGLLAELEVDEEDEEMTLDKQQQVDLAKTIEDCNTRLDEVKRTVQSNLWSRYGKGKLTFAIEEAESACEGAHAIPVSVVNKDAYEHQVDGAKKLINDVMTSFMEWEEWIPGAEKTLLDGRVRGLRKLKNSLEAKKAEFLVVQRTAEE